MLQGKLYSLSDAVRQLHLVLLLRFSAVRRGFAVTAHSGLQCQGDVSLGAFLLVVVSKVLFSTLFELYALRCGACLCFAAP